MKLIRSFNICILFFLLVTTIPPVTAKAIEYKPSGWYVGDQHIHSHYSWIEADPMISEIASKASTENFDWIIITDHGPMISTWWGGLGNAWAGIDTECDAEDSGSFRCMRGEEVGK